MLHIMDCKNDKIQDFWRNITNKRWNFWQQNPLLSHSNFFSIIRMLSWQTVPTVKCSYRCRGLHTITCPCAYLDCNNCCMNTNFKFSCLLTHWWSGLVVRALDYYAGGRQFASSFGLTISGACLVCLAVMGTRVAGNQRSLGVMLATSPPCVPWRWKYTYMWICIAHQRKCL